MYKKKISHLSIFHINHIIELHFIIPSQMSKIKSERKYDRQLRTFGHDTQRIIFETKVDLLTSYSIIDNHRTFIGAEILKNFLLLGINQISISKVITEQIKRILPDYKEINKDCKIKFCEDNSFDLQGGLILVRISNKETKKTFLICEKCLSYFIVEEENKSNHLCDLIPKKIELECLIGSILTQEIIKMISGQNYQKNFSLYDIDGLFSNKFEK